MVQEYYKFILIYLEYVGEIGRPKSLMPIPIAMVASKSPKCPQR